MLFTACTKDAEQGGWGVPFTMSSELEMLESADYISDYSVGGRENSLSSPSCSW